MLECGRTELKAMNDRRTVRDNHDRIRATAGSLGKCGFNAVRKLDIERDSRHSQFGGGVFCLFVEHSCSRIEGVEGGANAGQSRNRLFENFQTLAGQFKDKIRDARDVAAWVSEARYEPIGNKVSTGYQHDRNRRRGILG